MADKVYDLIQLDELSGGDQDFMSMMVDTFLEHTPGQLDELISAQASNYIVTFGAIAHKIKPNIDMFGIKAIISDIRDLEQLGKGGHNNDELKSKLENVKAELMIAFEQLRQR
jgi:HPt (histidine-containing phosphotransfer) domain-containing protein